MFNESRESRIKKENGYHLTLQIPENEYFFVYDSVSQQNATEIINHYLKIRQDDGQPRNIDIKHNKNAHVVNVEADLNYIGNDKVE